MQANPEWEYVADTVMGGISTGQIAPVTIDGREAMRLTGDVSLVNNGGFVQMAFDVGQDVAGFTGVEITVLGNNEVYDIRLRTTALTRPWQSFRTTFTAPPEWTTLRLPFADFEPNKTEATFDAAQLRRIGVLAYGREFKADIAVAEVRFYR